MNSFGNRFAALAALTLLTLPALAAGKVCDSHAYGAKADGTTKDTKAIQAAIDDCAKAGGGTVKLSGGTFLSGPIVLKTNITLDLAKDATLFGSPDHADYPVISEFRAPGTQSLVRAANAENIAITGAGTIDGNGESWWKIARTQHGAGIVGEVTFRPRLVVFDHCKHVRIEGVTIQNSPSWQVVPYYSDDVTIRNVRILAPQHSPNTDAIDPFSSSNMIIDHVFADVGDDNIAIKSGIINSPGPDEPSKNITITDCEFMHGHGLSIGSEIAGGAHNIHAERIHFKGTDQGTPHQSQPRPRQPGLRHLLQRHHHGGRQNLHPHQRLLPQGAPRRRSRGRSDHTSDALLPRHHYRERQIRQQPMGRRYHRPS